jgi:hypothetical protein
MTRSLYARLFKQGTAIFLSLCILWTSGNGAQLVALPSSLFIEPLSAPQFQLIPPPTLGKITDYFDASSQTLKLKRPLIVLIKDLHAHYGVQKNIAGLLDFLTEKLSKQKISPFAPLKSIPFALSVEGVQGPVDSSLLALFPNDLVKEEASQFLMREGELTGAEYFVTKHHLAKSLFGAENEELYNVHRHVFRNTLRRREDLVQALTSIQTTLKSLTTKTYQNELKAFQNKCDAYEEGTLSAETFFGFLASESERYHIGLKRQFPALAPFVTQGHLDSRSSDFRPQVLHTATVEFFNRTLSYLSAQDKKNLMFLAQQTENTSYYLYVRELIYKYQLFMAVPPELAGYLEYLHTQQTMGFDRVLHEAQELAFQIKLRLSSSKQEKDLIQVEHDVSLLKRLTDLQATEYEVRAFAPRLNQFVSLTRALLTANTATSQSRVFDQEAIHDLIASSIDYYVMAMMRNTPMVDHTVALLTAKAQGTAVLVAGGFHTAPITQILREKNISYVVISPTVDSISDADHALYVKRLKGDYLTPQQIVNLSERSDLAKGKNPLSLPEALAVGRFGWQLAGVAAVALAVSLGFHYQEPLTAALSHAEGMISSLSGLTPSTKHVALAALAALSISAVKGTARNGVASQQSQAHDAQPTVGSVLGTEYARQAPFLEWRFAVPFFILGAESKLRKASWQINPALTSKVKRAPLGKTLGWLGSIVVIASLLSGNIATLPLAWIFWSTLSGYVFSGTHVGTHDAIQSAKGQKLWALGSLLAAIATGPVFAMAAMTPFGLPFLMAALLLLPMGILFNMVTHSRTFLGQYGSWVMKDGDYNSYLQTVAFSWLRTLKKLLSVSGIGLVVFGIYEYFHFIAKSWDTSIISFSSTFIIPIAYLAIFITCGVMIEYLSRLLGEVRKDRVSKTNTLDSLRDSTLVTVPAAGAVPLPVGIDDFGAVMPETRTGTLQRNHLLLETPGEASLLVGVRREPKAQELDRLNILFSRTKAHLARYPHSHGSPAQVAQAHILLDTLEGLIPHIRLLEDHAQLWGYTDGHVLFLNERLFESSLNLEAIAYLAITHLHASNSEIDKAELMNVLFGSKSKSFTKAMVQFRLANQSRPLKQWTPMDFTYLPTYEAKQALSWSDDREADFQDRMSKPQTLEEKEIGGIQFAIEPGTLNPQTENMVRQYIANDKVFRKTLSGSKVYLGRLPLRTGEWTSNRLVEGFRNAQGDYFIGINEYLVRNAEVPELNAAYAIYQLGHMTHQFDGDPSDENRLNEILEYMGAGEKPVDHLIRDKRMAIEKTYWLRNEESSNLLRREKDDAAGIENEWGDESRLYCETREIFDQLLLAAGLTPSMYRLLIQDDKSMNGYAILNTNVVVLNRGFLEQALKLSGEGIPFNKDIVAAVLAHEIGHLIQGYRQFNEGTVHLNRDFYADRVHRYSALEKDSDVNWMLDLMDRAGFDVNQAPNLFRLLKRHLEKNEKGENYFGDHPTLDTRIREVEAEIRRRSWKNRRGLRFAGQVFSESFIHELQNKKLRQRIFVNTVHGLKFLEEAQNLGTSRVVPGDLRVGEAFISSNFSYRLPPDIESKLVSPQGESLPDYARYRGGDPSDVCKWMNSVVYDKDFLVRQPEYRDRVPAHLQLRVWDSDGKFLSTATDREIERANRLVLESVFPELLRPIGNLRHVLTQVESVKEIQLAVQSGIIQSFEAEAFEQTHEIMKRIEDQQRAFYELQGPLIDLLDKNQVPVKNEFETWIQQYVVNALLLKNPTLELLSKIEIHKHLWDLRPNKVELETELNRILPELQAICRSIEEIIKNEYPPSVLTERTTTLRSRTRQTMSDAITQMSEDPAMATFPVDIFQHDLYAMFNVEGSLAAVLEEGHEAGWLSTKMLSPAQDIPATDDLLPIWAPDGVDGSAYYHQRSRLFAHKTLAKVQADILNRPVQMPDSLEALFRHYARIYAAEKVSKQYFRQEIEAKEGSFKVLSTIIAHLSTNPNDHALKLRILKLIKERIQEGYESPLVQFTDHLGANDPEELYVEVRNVCNLNRGYIAQLKGHLNQSPAQISLAHLFDRLEKLTGDTIVDQLGETKSAWTFWDFYRRTVAARLPAHEQQLHATMLSYFQELMHIRRSYLQKHGLTEPMAPDQASRLYFRGLAGLWDMPLGTYDHRDWLCELTRIEDPQFNSRLTPWVQEFSSSDIPDWGALLAILKGDPQSIAYRQLAQAIDGDYLKFGNITLQTLQAGTFEAKDLEEKIKAKHQDDVTIKEALLNDFYTYTLSFFSKNPNLSAEMTPEGLRLLENGHAVLWIDRNNPRYQEIQAIMEAYSDKENLFKNMSSHEPLVLTEDTMKPLGIQYEGAKLIQKALFRIILEHADSRLITPPSSVPPLQIEVKMHKLSWRTVSIKPYPFDNLPEFKRLADEKLESQCRLLLTRYGQETLLAQIPRVLQALLVTIDNGGVPDYDDLEKELNKLSTATPKPDAKTLRAALNIASDLLEKQNFRQKISREDDLVLPKNKEEAIQMLRDKMRPRTTGEFLTYFSWLTYILSLKENAGTDPIALQRADLALAWFVSFSNPPAQENTLVARDQFYGEMASASEKAFSTMLGDRSPFASDGLNVTRCNFAKLQELDTEVMTGFDFISDPQESFPAFLARVTDPTSTFYLSPGIMRNYLIWYHFLKKVVFPHLSDQRYADLKSRPFHASLTLWRNVAQDLPDVARHAIFTEYARMVPHLVHDSRIESINQIMQGMAVSQQKLQFKSVDSRRTSPEKSAMDLMSEGWPTIKILRSRWKTYRMGKKLREQLKESGNTFEINLLPQLKVLREAVADYDQYKTFTEWLARSFGDGETKLMVNDLVKDQREDTPEMIDTIVQHLVGKTINLDATLADIRSNIEAIIRASIFPFDWFIRQFFIWNMLPVRMSITRKIYLFAIHSAWPQLRDALLGRYGRSDYQNFGLPSPYTSIEYFQPGNVSSDLIHLSSELNFPEIEKALEEEKTVEGKIIHLKTYLTDKSRHRDQFLKSIYLETKQKAEACINRNPQQPLIQLVGHVEIAGYQKDMLLLAQEFSSDLLVDQARLAALEMERILAPPSFQGSVQNELAIIQRFFPDFSLTRDDILRTMLARVSTYPDSMEIRSKMLSDRKNLKQKEVAEKSVLLDKFFEMFQNLSALDKAEFVLWALSIKQEKPFFLMQWEYAMKVDFSAVREMFSNEQNLKIVRLSQAGHSVDVAYYGATGYSLRKAFLQNFFEGTGGIFGDRPAKEYFLQEIFDAMIDKKTADRDRLWKIQRSIFHRAPREVQIRLVESLLENQVQRLREGRGSPETNRNRAIRMFLDSSGLIGKKFGQILAFSTLLRDGSTFRRLLVVFGRLLGLKLQKQKNSLRKELQQLGNSAAAEDRGVMMEEIHNRYNGRRTMSHIIQNLGNASAKVVYLVERNDGKLAVRKIKRPSIDHLVEQEMDTFDAVMSDLGEGSNGIQGAVREAVRQDMDFVAEVQNQEHMSDFYRQHSERAVPEKGYRFKIAEIYKDSIQMEGQTQEIEEEYLKGFRPLSDLIDENNVPFDIPTIKRLVFKELLRQLFIDGFYHADPHGHNILVGRNADGEVEIAFIDWGSVGRVKPEGRDQLLTWLVQSAISQKMNGLFAPEIPVDQVLVSTFFAKLGYLYEDMTSDEIAEMILDTMKETQSTGIPMTFSGQVPTYGKVLHAVSKPLWGQNAADLIALAASVKSKGTVPPSVGGSFFKNLFYKKYLAGITERFVGFLTSAAVYFGASHSLGLDHHLVSLGVSFIVAPALVYLSLTIGHIPFNREALQDKRVRSMIKDSALLAFIDLGFLTAILAIPGIPLGMVVATFVIISIPLLIKHYRLNLQGHYAYQAPNDEQKRMNEAIPVAISAMKKIPVIKDHTATDNVPPKIGVSPNFTAAAKDLFTLTQA